MSGTRAININCANIIHKPNFQGKVKANIRLNDEKIMENIKDQYYDLAYYTLSHPDSSFIHQNIVDAYTAQNADNESKPISVIFALAGLYLHLEKNYTGKQVRTFHQKMAENKKPWPKVKLPLDRGAITISDVLKVAPGPERDKKIHIWCESVWNSYKQNISAIIELVEKMNQ